MSKTMLINNVEGHECRIAVLDGGRLDELYTERASSVSAVGSVYKGKVTNIEPSIQAAFVDFGGPKNGFLHISDVHPYYFPKRRDKDKTETVGRRTAHRTRPPIQDCLRRGAEVIVQMTKEGIGTKGPTLTTYLSLPGRLVVMMPGMTQVGISRKIEDDAVRQKLRKVLDDVTVPEDMGVIVRTAGADRTKREIQRDVSYLYRLWGQIKERRDTMKAPAVLYRESDLVLRTLRDVYSSEIARIICDSPEVGRNVKDFLDLSVPRHKSKIELYRGAQGLFEEFGVEEEIQKIHSHRVELKGGGSLVIDQTEALVAIDVNSGSFRQHKDPERNTLALNLLAADEIGRQLRLRDMGGVIVIDFVDLRDTKNRRELEKKVRDVLKNDRAKSKVLRMSSFGLVEMTRQRLRPSLKQSVYSRCTVCDGTGFTPAPESVALRALRDLRVAVANDDAATVTLTVAPSVASHLLNAQRKLLVEIEEQSDKTITVVSDPELAASDVTVTCMNHRGSTVPWDAALRNARPGGKSNTVDMLDVLAGKTDIVLPERKYEAEPFDEDEDFEDEEEEDEAEAAAGEAEAEAEKKPKKRSRRGRRGGRKHKKTDEKAEEAEAAQPKSPDETEADASKDAGADGEAQPKRKSRRRSRKKKAAAEPKDAESKDTEPEPAPADEPVDAPESDAVEGQSAEEESAEKPKKRRRRGRRGGRGRKKSADGEPAAEPEADGGQPDAPEDKPDVDVADTPDTPADPDWDASWPDID